MSLITKQLFLCIFLLLPTFAAKAQIKPTNSVFGLTTVGAFVLVGMMALPEMSK